MSCLLSVSVTAGLFTAGWLLWHWKLRKERRRLEHALDWMASGGDPERLQFLEDTSLSSLLPPLERIGSELGRLRQQVQEEAFNLQSILASMEEGVMIVDDRHVLRLINPSFVRMFDLKYEPLGLSILHTLRETVVQEMVAAALRSSEPQSGEFRTNGGRPARDIALNVVPVRDTHGRPSVLAIFRDVSRLKQLEQVRREFVANVSHELRTPLSIFHGYVENLLDNPDLPREDLVGVLGILKRHSARLNALLEDLLSIARLEARTEVFHPEPIALEPFIARVTKDWSGKIAAKKVTLEIDVPADLPHLIADPLRLEQVVGNLLENALKYTPASGSITVQAEVEREQIVITFADDGTGILPQDLPHIFERFYRADKSRTREQGGTGLGLSIVKHIVQTHGGTATAESIYGKGTTIILRFPLTGPLAVAATKRPVEAEPQSMTSGQRN